jgi:DNA-binding NarL/FixJ family response regulator
MRHLAPPGAVLCPAAVTDQVVRTGARVVLVDDDEAMRMLLRVVLDSEDGFSVVGEAADGRTGCELILETKPELAIVDLHMPQMSGLELISEVRQRGSAAKILIHSGDDVPPGPPEPDAFVLKDGNVEALVEIMVSLVTTPGG